MNDELLALAERIVNTPHSWLPTEGCVKNITFNATECSILHDALRHAAQSQEPVTVKPLVWVDHRPDSFPEPAWSAQTPFGFYNIEEVSASDCPAYVVRLHAHRFVADKDSLDAAKAAAQADYEQRIRSALVNVPMSASDGALREALEQIRTVCIDNAGDTVRHDLALKFIGKIASRVLAASEATKSDGGVERRHAVDDGGATRPTGDAKAVREAGVAPGPSDLDARLERLQDEATDLGYVLTPEPEHPDSPHASDTRPADVTVDARVIDNDRDEISVTLNGNELRGWSYSTEQERRVKMLCAREFVEGFRAGRQP